MGAALIACALHKLSDWICSMFKINPNPTFSKVVKITQPGSDEPALLNLTFAHKGRDELKQWSEALKGRNDEDALPDIVVGWDDVVDANGVPVAFSKEALATVLKGYQSSATEIYQAYFSAVYESRQKN